MYENRETAGSPWTFLTRGEGETRELASRLARLLRPGDVILLVGELGSGKTTFVKGLAEGLGVRERVISPTFTLHREYRGRLPLHHLDAYRLRGARDLSDLGVEELLEGEGVVAVEWGERARELFGDEYLEVNLSYGGEDNERVIRLFPGGGTWMERLGALGEDAHGG